MSRTNTRLHVQKAPPHGTFALNRHKNAIFIAAAVLLLCGAIFVGGVAGEEVPPPPFKITFIGNGGDGSMEAQDIPTGSGDVTVQLNPCAFTRTDDQKFIGWKKGDSATYYTDRQSIKITSAEAASGIVLTAQWAQVIPVDEISDIERPITGQKYYKLTTNVTGIVPVNSGALVVLDLNGHVLNGLVIINSGVLTIIDSNASAGHFFKYTGNTAWTYAGETLPDDFYSTKFILTGSEEGFTPFTREAADTAAAEAAVASKSVYVKVTGGCITGGNTTSDGGGVCVYSGTFTMSGGNIVGNSAWLGGGVYVKEGCEFTMSGGTIVGNTASNGGGVFVAGEFTMSGGCITGGSATDGGGVCVNGSGTFNMSGGNITGNTATGSNGGGGGVSVAGEFTMSGGNIVGNTATGNGGGVYAYGSFKMSGSSSITGNTASENGGGVYSSGTFTMSGSSSIAGNTASENGGGVYVAHESTFNISGSPIIRNNTAASAAAASAANNVWLISNVVTITGDGLKDGAYLGITTYTHPTAENPVTITNAYPANCSAYFHSDNPAYVIQSKEISGKYLLQLVSTGSVKYTLTYEKGDAESGDVPAKPATYPYETEVKVCDNTGKLAKHGFVFAGWIDESGAEHAVGSTIKMVKDTTLSPLWTEAPKYQVEYNLNGGEGTAPVDQNTYYVGDSVPVLKPTESMKREGYTFICWNDINKLDYEPGTTFTLRSDMVKEGKVTLSAKWQEIPKYDIEVLTDSSHGTVRSDPAKAAEGITVTLYSKAKTGYKFDKWESSDVTIDANNQFTMPAKNVKITGYFIPKKYKVTYDANGATGTAPSDPTEYVYGTNFTVMDKGALERTGYRFSGWNSQADGQGLDYEVGKSYPIQPDLTLYANWIKVEEHDIIISVDGHGKAWSDPVAAKADDVVTLHSEADTGYKFDKWESSAVVITDNTFTMPDNDVKIKAHFTPRQLTVTYSENGGTPSTAPEKQICHWGDTVTVAEQPEEMIREGYTFVGWNTKEDGTGQDYNPGDALFVTENVKLYADWVKIPVYDIKVLTDGPGTAGSDLAEAPEGTLITLSQQADEGYEFKGWESSDVTIDANNQFTMPGKNVTITASFKPIPAPKPSRDSRSQGSSYWATTEPTATPTATPTLTPTPADVPTVKPVTAQPTQTGASPMPLAGILAGLGAAFSVLGLRRK